MTIANYRLKLTRVNNLKIRVSTRLPAQIAATSPLTLDSSSGTRTFGLSIDDLRDSLDSIYATTPISASNLPYPTSSSLGGITSLASTASKWINAVSTSGVPSATQPSFTDLTGNIAVAQMNSGTSASSSTYWRGDGTWASGAAGSSIGKQISGLVPSNNVATPLTKLDVSAGNARSSDQTTDITLGSGITKIEGAWAVGTGNGGLDSGSTFANSTGYHIHLIYHPTGPVVDVLFSTSATAPTMPSGYTKRRCIGGFITDGSGDILPGLWRSDGSFRLTTPLVEVNGAASNLLTLQSLRVPLGVKMEVNLTIGGANTVDATAAWFMIADPDVGAIADDTLQWRNAQLYKTGGTTVSAFGNVREYTDTSGRVYYWGYPKDSDNLIYIYLLGWKHPREELS